MSLKVFLFWLQCFWSIWNNAGRCRRHEAQTPPWGGENNNLLLCAQPDRSCALIVNSRLRAMSRLLHNTAAQWVLDTDLLFQVSFTFSLMITGPTLDRRLNNKLLHSYIGQSLEILFTVPSAIVRPRLLLLCPTFHRGTLCYYLVTESHAAHSVSHLANKKNV